MKKAIEREECIFLNWFLRVLDPKLHFSLMKLGSISAQTIGSEAVLTHSEDWCVVCALLLHE
jgi:hypothetical protein